MAANPAAQLPPQPDFTTISRHFDDLSLQFSRCANIPALDAGAAILQAIQGLRDDMNRRFDDISRRQDRLERQQATLDRNNQARLANGHLFKTPDEDLAPLYSLSTHEPIPRFPRSLAAIDGLSTRDLDPLLEHLNIAPEGPIARRRLAFKRAVGVFGAYTPFSQ